MKGTQKATEETIHIWRKKLYAFLVNSYLVCRVMPHGESGITVTLRGGSKLLFTIQDGMDIDD